ncbi:phosphotransferase enzyme family protein [Bacillus sp. AK031]
MANLVGNEKWEVHMMERWVEDLFSKEVLQKAAEFYGADIANAKKLGDFENYVFEIHKNDRPYILRLTHSSHRCKDQVEAELEWVNYLHSQGVNVSLVSHSENGNIVEEIPVDDTSFFVCLFDKAPGEPVSVKSEWMAPALYKEWGRTIGKMHRVTKDYQEGETAREHWYDDDLLKNMEIYLPSTEEAIVKGGKELVKQLTSLSAGKEEYGLIHSDIHSGNFFYHEGEVHVFDFDDSSYHWFASDIAIPLFYSTWAKMSGENLNERSGFGEEFLTHFLKGYFEENSLGDEWIKRIPLFLKLRDYVLFTVFNKKFDVENLSAREASAISGIKERLERDELMVSLDYEQILNKVKGE